MRKKVWIRVLSVLCVLTLIALQPITRAASGKAEVTEKNGTKQTPKAHSGSKSDQKEESSRATATSKVDLNTADRDTLIALPGVGPALADAIIASRPFKSVSQLQDVNGIGEAKYKDLQSKVVVHRASPTAKTTTKTSSTKHESTGDSVTKSPNDRKPVSSSAGAPAASTTTKSGKINLNTASQEELESLPDIGPVKAKAIIENRPYKSPEDVMKVKGIKEGTYDQIKDLITVR
jgi:competence ComEA-like helix-hairpin-helix protein